MIKQGRKPSSDPVQERLRDEKAKFNKPTSDFIDNLIHLKKLLNGSPSKFFEQRTLIQNPLPADPISIIDSLASDFQELAQKARKIVQQQNDYSKTRRKKVVRKLPTPTTPANDNRPSNLTQQLSALPVAATLEATLVAEGSTWLSRFLSSLRTPWFFGSEEELKIGRYRRSMIGMLADLYKTLYKLEGEIVGLSFNPSKSIRMSNQYLSQIVDQVQLLEDTYEKSTTEKKKEDQPKLSEDKAEEQKKSDVKSQKTKPVDQKSSEENPLITRAKHVLNDFHRNFHAKPEFQEIIPSAMVNKFYSLHEEFRKPGTDSHDLAKQIIDLYTEMLALANAKFGTSSSTFEEIVLPFEVTSSLKTIYATNFLAKWFGKVFFSLKPLDQSAALRIELFKKAEQMRSLVNECLDILEDQEASIDQVKPYIKNFVESMFNMMNLMDSLLKLVNIFLSNEEATKQLQEKSLLSYDFDADNKTRNLLENTIRRRKAKEYSKIIAR